MRWRISAIRSASVFILISLLFQKLFQLLLAPVHKVRYLLLGASQHLCGLPVAQFFKIDQKKCLPVFLFELAQCGVQLLVLFVLEQPGFGQCLVRQFKRQFLQRQKKPPPGLAA